MASRGRSEQAHGDALQSLDRIFHSLADEQSRVQAAIDLQNLISSTVSESPSDANAKLWDDEINERVALLSHSSSVSHRLGAVAAISKPRLYKCRYLI